MKNRHGFVSNSSSSSFIVSLSKISGRDLDIILKYPTWASEHGNDWWDFSTENGVLMGWTNMDNNELDKYLKENGVDTTQFGYDQD